MTIAGEGKGSYFEIVQPAFPPSTPARPRPLPILLGGLLAGLALFAAGFATHVRADAVLRGVRAVGGPRYGIPRGFLFDRVSCPNYLGEIVTWCGWALLTWSAAGGSFAVWTAANLVPRALAHHRWYRTTFPDYPPGRKAIVPGLL